MPAAIHLGAKICEHCGNPFERRSFRQRDKVRLEAATTFIRRRFCCNECQTARFASERNGRRVTHRALLDAVSDGHNTARKLADHFGVAGVQAKELREKLDDMMAAMALAVAGRVGKNEVVYQLGQARMPSLPMFVEGPGERRDDCRLYEDCLNRYDLAHPNLDADAHCPSGCSAFSEVPREYWYQAANAGRGMSQAARCEAAGIEASTSGYARTSNRIRG